jgi:hypothetical protein
MLKHGGKMRTLLLFMLACGPGKDTGLDTSAVDADVPDPKTGEGCTHHLRVNGTPIEEMGSPRVGTSWYVLLWCDNILEQGPSVLQISPPHLASVDPSDPIMTFEATGNGTVSMQVGTLFAENAVTIQD